MLSPFYRRQNLSLLRSWIHETAFFYKYVAANPVDGYVLTLTVTSKPAFLSLTADPASAAQGSKHFYLDSVSREIRVDSDKPAGPNDPVLNK